MFVAGYVGEISKSKKLHTRKLSFQLLDEHYKELNLHENPLKHRGFKTLNIEYDGSILTLSSEIKKRLLDALNSGEPDFTSNHTCGVVIPFIVFGTETEIYYRRTFHNTAITELKSSTLESIKPGSIIRFMKPDERYSLNYVIYLGDDLFMGWNPTRISFYFQALEQLIEEVSQISENYDIELVSAVSVEKISSESLLSELIALRNIKVNMSDSGGISQQNIKATKDSLTHDNLPSYIW